MKILITGSNGQVGLALVKQLTNHNLVPISRDHCDFTNLDKIKHIIDKHKPGLIINTAAYTNVDKAEDEEEIAYLVNCCAPKVMAETALEKKIPFIHFSTDYVFDGKKDGAYIENDSANPLGIYGKSKLEGDKAIQKIGGQFYIFRTSWVYSNTGENFYLRIKKLSMERDQLSVVSDQLGVPTSSKFIAAEIEKIIAKLNFDNTGVYNLVPNGQCTRYDFAKAIILKNNPKFNINKLFPINTKDFPSKADRPLNGVLDNKYIQTVFMLEFDNWQSVLNKL